MPKEVKLRREIKVLKNVETETLELEVPIWQSFGDDERSAVQQEMLAGHIDHVKVEKYKTELERREAYLMSVIMGTMPPDEITLLAALSTAVKLVVFTGYKSFPLILQAVTKIYNTIVPDETVEMRTVAMDSENEDMLQAMGIRKPPTPTTYH